MKAIMEQKVVATSKEAQEAKMAKVHFCTESVQGHCIISTKLVKTQYSIV